LRGGRPGSRALTGRRRAHPKGGVSRGLAPCACQPAFRLGLLSPGLPPTEMSNREMRHMARNRGIGSIAMTVVAIAAMTLVRTLRWNELGLLASIMIVVLWIAITGGATALA
jgi:hypothetical protein